MWSLAQFIFIFLTESVIDKQAIQVDGMNGRFQCHPWLWQANVFPLTERVALEILPGLPHTSQNSEDLLEKKALVKQFLEANQLPVEEQGEELVILDSVRLRQDF